MNISIRHPLLFLCTLSFAAFATNAASETVKIQMTVKEIEIAVDNKGTKQLMWAYDGTVPGPLVRVKQGDVVQFSLTNDKDNKNSHSMDFHAAIVDVLDEFAEIKPGERKYFEFEARYPGVFIYHCGASSMAEHISKGMYGVIIVDPKDGYTEAYPRPDREYVLVQGDLFAESASADARRDGQQWSGALVNGRMFHYDPVHDSSASKTLLASPGERVRIFYVNASINDPVALHPIAGIWDRVYDHGNPRNITYGVQTFTIPPASAAAFDLIPPAGRASNNAIVDHAMKRALNGAITVLSTYEGADETLGRGENLILR
ncbi:MAG: multicopper oxidase domain-containing protein [Gammaproteobacteria bacterium]|nr:multicopper oxidase domain-containing protein [Gammaproteobacteria bacterium]